MFAKSRHAPKMAHGTIKVSVVLFHLETAGVHVERMLCELCHSGDAEDEQHFPLACNKHDGFKRQWIKFDNKKL